MSPERWEQIEKAYHAALEIDPEHRAAYLMEACGGDDDLRKEIDSLLAQDTSASGLLLNLSPAAPAATALLKPGTRLGPYLIETMLGSGGMGEVWMARDTRLQRGVAIKVVRSEKVAGTDSGAEKRLWKEARAAAQVSHPNLCQLFDVIDDGCHVYLVMELLEGRPLSARIAGGAMPACEANSIMHSVLDALEVLHNHGLVHCDLKPSNVFLTPTGVKVLDFGLAVRQKRQDAAAGTGEQTLTQTVSQPDLLAGTPAYMAPERIDGAASAPPADLFAAGCVLFEMLAGTKAFAGETVSQVFNSIINGGPSLSDLPEESRRFWPVIERALAKKPADRFASAAEMRESLDRYATQPVGDVPKRFGPALRAVVGVLAVAMCAGGVWLAGHRGLFERHTVAENTGPRSIAVLPIANRTRDASLDYLAEGTTSNIIRQLSAVPGLRVISKNSVQQFRASDDPRKAAATLGVDHILTGSIDGSGDLRMEFELSRGFDGSVLLSRQYRPDTPDLLETQSTVVDDIVQSLAMTLTSEERKKLRQRPTLNKEAWDSYLRGEHVEELVTPESLNAALPLYQKALDKDPGFALAMSRLASTHLKLGMFFDDPRRHMPIAKQSAVRALSLDDSLADAHGVLGLVGLLYDWDYAEAGRQLLLGSGTMNPAALHNLACSTHLLESTGRGKRAVEELNAAMLTDPLSATIQSELGCNAYYSRQYGRAVREFDKALLLRPKDLNSLWGLGRSYAQQRMFSEAETSLKAAMLPDGSAPPIILGELGYVYGLSGRKPEARGIIRQMQSLRGKAFVDPFLEAVVHLSMGEMNETFANLEEAYRVRSAFLISLKSDPKWDRVHSDPRLQALLHRIGFSGR